MFSFLLFEKGKAGNIWTGTVDFMLGDRIC